MLKNEHVYNKINAEVVMVKIINGYHDLLCKIYETQAVIISNPNDVQIQNINKELVNLDNHELCKILEEQMEEYKKYLYLTVKRFIEMKTVYIGDENAMSKAAIAYKEIDEIITELTFQKYNIFQQCDYMVDSLENFMEKDLDRHAYILKKITSVYAKVTFTKEEKEIYKKDKSKRQFILQEIKNIGKAYESLNETDNIVDKLLNKLEIITGKRL